LFPHPQNKTTEMSDSPLPFKLADLLIFFALGPVKKGRFLRTHLVFLNRPVYWTFSLFIQPFDPMESGHGLSSYLPLRCPRCSHLDTTDRCCCWIFLHALFFQFLFDLVSHYDTAFWGFFFLCSPCFSPLIFCTFRGSIRFSCLKFPRFLIFQVTYRAPPPPCEVRSPGIFPTR